jgi:hypothetical protein
LKQQLSDVRLYFVTFNGCKLTTNKVVKLPGGNTELKSEYKLTNKNTLKCMNTHDVDDKNNVNNLDK